MSYSIDLRERVIGYVQGGGSQGEACRLFNVDRKTIYRWLHRPAATLSGPRTRQRVIDKAALARDVLRHPDMLLRERAAQFGVTPSGMWRALRALGMRKKNDEIFAER